MPLDSKYSKTSFEQASNTNGLCRELSIILSERLRAAFEPDKEVDSIIADMSALGHELWSWDASYDWQMWGSSESPPAEPEALKRP